MFIKWRTEFFSKNLFLLLVIASLALHAIIIFMSPQANQILSLKSLRDSFVREPSEYAVTLEIEDHESPVSKKEDELKKEEIPEKKKYKIFTDTSDNAEDEETSADTDKIGAKGAVAKDYFPDDQLPVNNEPHAEGHSRAPFLGKGNAGVPSDPRQQPPPEQAATAQVFVSEDGSEGKTTPPRYANLPKGLENQGSPAKPPPIKQPPVSSEERKKSMAEVKAIKLEETKENTSHTPAPKRERLTIGRGALQEEAEPLPASEGVLFTDKQDERDNKIETETEEEPASSLLREEKTGKESGMKMKEAREIKNSPDIQPEMPQIPPVAVPESSGVEPQRMLEKGLNVQESPGEVKKPKVSFNVNAKTEGANNDPVLFEDTISNAAIPGAPSFNVKKHEYANYFKHIRDRISLYWFLGYGTRAELKLETRDDKPVIVEFKVLPDGSVGEVKIVDDAGNFNLASRLVSSIKNAAPLNPFPSNIKEPSIDVRFNFYFF
ncbi:MAG: hypothetical protein DCC43_11075 [Candidatus Brocadia sp.]|jgi:hypothetical protein|nr:hypothetical protein [Candidatus Brocadia fulgida]MCC6325324.1 hypothetical protein [Candidatus Brocadia sp.]MCE7912261.1 hypothetical protein [Candidatus Brocadia sp. AMX3]OQY98121.1 MAG: hypothetical protein B6D35_12975 [Candidatus Brocadia sp. UTAMX2]RIJ96371.1 MAG: hypothetical protein DCC43_11075 [Candidatus Brocadia sp.]